MKTKTVLLSIAVMLLVVSFSLGDQPIHYYFNEFIEIYPYQGQHYASMFIDEGPTDCDAEAWLSWWNYPSEPDDNELARGYFGYYICDIAVFENDVSSTPSGSEPAYATNVDVSDGPLMLVFHGMYVGDDNFFFYRIKYGVTLEGTYSDPDMD